MTVTHTDRHPVEAQLLPMVDACDDVPLIGSPEWLDLDVSSPCWRASVARAAICWWRDGTEDAIRRRLLDELAFNDEFAAWRLHAVSLDLAADTEHWKAARRRVSWAELQRRRGVGS